MEKLFSPLGTFWRLPCSIVGLATLIICYATAAYGLPVPVAVNEQGTSKSPSAESVKTLKKNQVEVAACFACRWSAGPTCLFPCHMALFFNSLRCHKRSQRIRCIFGRNPNFSQPVSGCCFSNVYRLLFFKDHAVVPAPVHSSAPECG